jgi:hypothetical protein
MHTVPSWRVAAAESETGLSHDGLVVPVLTCTSADAWAPESDEANRRRIVLSALVYISTKWRVGIESTSDSLVIALAHCRIGEPVV